MIVIAERMREVLKAIEEATGEQEKGERVCEYCPLMVDNTSCPVGNDCKGV
jgi:hypothetical protein